MRNKLILNLAISIDGFIADKDGGYDWIKPSGNPALNTAAAWSHERFLEHVGAVVMGRTCYDEGMHAEYRNKQVYVVTSRPLEDYENIHFIGKDVCAEVSALKEGTEGDVYLFGGGMTVDPLLKAGMIDEYIIGIIPMMLGRGIPLFLPNNPSIPLHLAEYYVEDGIVVLKYTPRHADG